MAVEIRNLCKSFDGLNVYENFNFTIEEGVVTAITGPSGCGKTTFLRMLAGLEEPDSGTIRRIAETDQCGGTAKGAGTTKGRETTKGAGAEKGSGTAKGTGADAEHRGGNTEDGSRHGETCRGKTGCGFGQPCGKTAVVFQEDRLLPWLTVKENLRLVLEGDGAEDGCGEAAEEAGRWTIAGMIRFMGLSGFEDYYPEALSGGMKRRVAISRALLYGGDILLMDEPFKGLDDELKQDIMKVLAAEWKRRRSTVVLITHDREDADVLADRLWEFGGKPLSAKPAGHPAD